MTININEYNNELLFIPLGGSGEIGLNVNLYQYKGKWLMVDLGAGFAEKAYLPGVDIIVPDLTFIMKYKHNLLGLVLTHAHEDHLGAIQYVWDQLKCPIYATPFTAAFLKAKLSESRGQKHDIKIHEVKIDGELQIGPFDIEFVSITHSAPEMQGLYIKTDRGNVFHTGDWKLDDDPVVGNATNEEKLKEIGDRGVLAVIGDSTNVFNHGHSGSEGELAKSLEKIISGVKGLVAVTTFASNLARVQTIVNIAKATNRKVMISGRSLWRIIRAAQDSGYLDNAAEFLDEKSFSRCTRSEILLLCTGCQGEPLAATSKIATHTHNSIRFIPGDTVIFSSKIIPGNDKSIYRLFNLFVKMGVEVLTERDHFVHVSGHPARQELQRMYELLRPKVLIPVHGEHIHIHEHVKFGKSLGIEQQIEVENGDVVLLSEDNCEKLAVVEAGYLAVDGNYLLAPTSNVMKQRRRLTRDGVIFAALLFDKQNRLIGMPHFKSFGVLDEENDKALVVIIIDEIIDYLQTRQVQNVSKFSAEDTSNSIRSLIKKIISSEVGKTPYIEVYVEKV